MTTLAVERAAPAFDMPPTIARALGSAEETLGIFGPVATSKTSSVCEYVYAHCRKYSAQYPGQTIRWVFVRDTFESIKMTTLKTWLQWLPAPQCGRWNESKKLYTVRLPRGQHAEVLFTGLDDEKDVSRLLSMDLTGAVIEEPSGGIGEGGVIYPGIPEFVYRGVISRIRHPIGCPRRRLIVIGNPPPTSHWCYRVFRPDLAQPREGKRCVNVPKEEAPILKVEPDYYEKLRVKYGAGSPDALRYIDGVWLKSLAGGFHRDMVRLVPREALPAFTAIGATLDPAAGGQSGAADRSAIAVAGFQIGGYATLLELRVGRFTPGELIAAIFELQERAWPGGLRIGAFGFEAVGFQTWIEHMIIQQHQIRMKDGRPPVYIPMVPLPRDTRVKKESRIQGALGVRLAYERLAAVADCTNLDAFYGELEAFPEGDHDDMLDAVADLDSIAKLAVPAAAVMGDPGAARPAADEPAELRDPDRRLLQGESFHRSRGSMRMWGTGGGRRLTLLRGGMS